MTTETFDRDVLASEQPVIVDFGAPWCGPCHAVAPVLERIAAERSEELSVVKVNIDEEPELAVRFGVASIPTILLFADGAPVAGAVGARNKAQLEQTGAGRLHGLISRFGGGAPSAPGDRESRHAPIRSNET